MYLRFRLFQSSRRNTLVTLIVTGEHLTTIKDKTVEIKYSEFKGSFQL